MTLSSIRLGWILLLSIILIGCGAAPSPTPDPEIDPKDVLLRAVERIMTLETGEFTLEHREGTTTLLPGLEMHKVYGVADIPDKFRFTVEAEFSNTYIETGVVVIEDQAYMTNFLTGQWEEISQDLLPLNFANLGQTLADIIDSVSDPIMVGVDRIDGRDVFVIRGTVMSNDLSTMVPNAGKGFEVELELWVDRSDYLLRQVVMSGQLVDTDEITTVRVLTLENVDVPVEIVRPE